MTIDLNLIPAGVLNVACVCSVMLTAAAIAVLFNLASLLHAKRQQIEHHIQLTTAMTTGKHQ